jgi:hypothetical protein
VEPECGSESPMAPAPYSSDSHQRWMDVNN